MKVYYALEDFSPLPKAVVTTGTFDGVHIGHRKILNQLQRVAEQCSGESVLLTFQPHPRKVLQPDLELKMLNSQSEKIELLKETGLQHLIIHPFTRDFSRTRSLDFVREILARQIGAHKLVIGYDHHFGKNREGSFEHLKKYGPEYGFEVEEISAQDIENTTVSSTKIRKALEQGDLDTANDFLGYPYLLSGTVTEGEHIGQQLGYPTANLVLEDNEKIIPANGVYAVQVQFPAEDKRLYQGMCNIGIRPTFGGKFQTIEAHLFDFGEAIYGKLLQLTFVKRLRDEKAFDSREALIEQLGRDEQAARQHFQRHSNKSR